jgi:hypothetical protein
MGLNIPGYTLFCISGIDKHKACILSTNMNILMPPGFYHRQLVAVLINYNEGKAEKRLVVCSAYLPCDSKDQGSSPDKVLGGTCVLLGRGKPLFSHSVQFQCTPYGMG